MASKWRSCFRVFLFYFQKPIFFFDITFFLINCRSHLVIVSILKNHQDIEGYAFLTFEKIYQNSFNYQIFLRRQVEKSSIRALNLSSHFSNFKKIQQFLFLEQYFPQGRVFLSDRDILILMT